MKQIDLNNIKEIRLLSLAPKSQLNATGGKVELRLGSPTGKLIGEYAFLEPTDKMDFKPNTLTIPIKTPVMEGKLQDIYLVYVNPAKPAGSLMVVMGVEFVMASTGE